MSFKKTRLRWRKCFFFAIDCLLISRTSFVKCPPYFFWNMEVLIIIISVMTAKKFIVKCYFQSTSSRLTIKFFSKSFAKICLWVGRYQARKTAEALTEQLIKLPRQEISFSLENIFKNTNCLCNKLDQLNLTFIVKKMLKKSKWRRILWKFPLFSWHFWHWRYNLMTWIWRIKNNFLNWFFTQWCISDIGSGAS